MNDLELLIAEPRETLEVELKCWIDLADNGARASLAKELIALANHGGGHLLIGFDDIGLTAIPRPSKFAITVDDVNAVVSRYADPDFQCELIEVHGHPVIRVPGGHKLPIRSIRNGPGNEIVQDRYYIRRPGPKSEPPKKGLEWDVLLRRCIDNRESELEATVTRVVRVLQTTTKEPPLDPVASIRKLL